MTVRHSILSALILCMAGGTVTADFHPERIYRERSKIRLNSGWKFYRGDPSGDPAGSSFNDAAWQTVSIPHSASYDEPTFEAELEHYKGIVWYRKRFTVPASAKTGTIQLEFEGAMQRADVWLNGQKVGASHVSGYTWFPVDISGKTVSGENVLAVKLDNTYSAEIPPGNVGNPANYNTFPDYHLFSGLYRDVWLVCTDNVHIPLYGQRISTPEVSKSAAKVRVKTVVKNSGASEKSVTLRYVVTDSNATVQLSEEITATIAAGASHTFDRTSEPIENPKLWSMDAPYLYRVYTQVLIDGSVVDDFVERFGIRWFEYSLTEGFKLNGEKVFLNAVNLHQTFAWVQNAVPVSRFYEEIRLVKEMGANMIRTAHYPRAPAFYRACDELGILLFVEVPTWGVNTPSYPAIFWSRLDTCVVRMIEVGYNHPSIMMWGLFNEPASEQGDNYFANITRLNTTAKTMDSTRKTSMANTSDQAITHIPDIIGVNYNTRVATAHPDKIRLNTEYHEGWIDFCSRCDACEGTYATTRWNDKWVPVRDLKDANGNNTYIGGCMWSFNDYSSVLINQPKPMGVVDFYRIPKRGFYLFRKNWTGVAEDYPVAGVTPRRITLEPDLTELISDSTDFSRIIAAVRDDEGRLADVSVDITFQISGPANHFGPLTRKTECGKLAIMVTSTMTPGSIKVKALAANLAPDSVIITSVLRETGALPFVTPVIIGRMQRITDQVHFSQKNGALTLAFPAQPFEEMRVELYTLQGRVVSRKTVRNSTTLSFSTVSLPSGYYCLQVSGSSGQVLKRFAFTHLQ